MACAARAPTYRYLVAFESGNGKRAPRRSPRTELRARRRYDNTRPARLQHNCNERGTELCACKGDQAAV